MRLREWECEIGGVRVQPPYRGNGYFTDIRNEGLWESPPRLEPESLNVICNKLQFILGDYAEQWPKYSNESRAGLSTPRLQHARD